MTVYSHSRLNSFENCPKQFQFRYVMKIEQETEGIEAFVGKRVHEVLERLYEFVDRGQVPPLQKVVDRYYQLYDKHYDAERIRIVKKGIEPAFYRELGARCLNNYYRRHYPFDADETLGIEERVIFELDELGKYKMQGIIDRVARAPDGVIEIIDYKTGQWVPNQDKIDKDRQLALYQIGLQKVYGPKQPIRLVWHYVAKGITRTSERTGEQLESLKRKTIDVIDTIQRETAYEPKKSRLCDWCEYRALCPLFQDEASSGATSKSGSSDKSESPPKPPPLIDRRGQLNLL
ncbi:MAG: PD-(D/E)XK nuclease family protein [Myxococcota bacterium]|nr:PD-(D/E)XK nuclease family protein [Myxococcota bacterium]